MEKLTGGCVIQPSKGLRDMGFAYGPVKELSHVALVQDVQIALDKWRHSKTFRRSRTICDMGLLVGDLAMSFYAKPRYADRVEVLYPDASSIPGGVDGFTRHHKGVFQEDISKIEVWTLTSESLHIPQGVVEKISYSAYVVHDGLMVASLEGMIVLKLYASDNRRFEYQALGDIGRMLENNPQISAASFDGWSLSDFHLNKLNTIVGRASNERGCFFVPNGCMGNTRFGLTLEQEKRFKDWLVTVTQRAAKMQEEQERVNRPPMLERMLKLSASRQLSDKEEWMLSRLKSPLPRPLPFYGEDEGGISFTFTPTKHGTYCRATESITGEFIDLDDLGWG